MSTDTPPSNKHSATTHTKADALSDREFQLLLEGCAAMRDYYGFQARFVCLVAGRLGMRAGEIAHLREEWVDWRRNMIVVPRHEPCQKGTDGGPCGYCRQQAQQRVEYNDAVTLEDALACTWSAKTDAAAREIPFDFDPRVSLVVERFFDRFDGWEWSAQAVNRRVKRAAEHATGLDPEDVRPHSLRATAASHHAGRGLEMHALMQHFGWAKASTADCYLSRNSKNTARQLDSIHTS